MKEISWAACLRLGATAVAVYMICAGGDRLSALTGIMTPLLMGGGVAYVAGLPMEALERRLFPRGGRLGRAVCLTLSLAGGIALTAWLAWVILPELLRGVALLAGELPGLLTAFAEWLERSGAAAWLRLAPNWHDLTERAASMALEGAGRLLGTAAETLSALTAGAANLALAVVFAAYILAGKERLGAQLTCLSRRLLGERAHGCIVQVLRALNEALRTYVKGQALEALLLGCLCLLGMMALGLPGALTISVLAGVSAAIPLAGTPLAAAAGAAMLMPCGAGCALKFLFFFLILQQVESNLIYPRLVGATLGLPPVWMLTVMLLGGGLFGLPGAVLAVPVASAAKTLLTQ